MAFSTEVLLSSRSNLRIQVKPVVETTEEGETKFEQIARKRARDYVTEKISSQLEESRKQTQRYTLVSADSYGLVLHGDRPVEINPVFRFDTAPVLSVNICRAAFRQDWKQVGGMFLPSPMQVIQKYRQNKGTRGQADLLFRLLMKALLQEDLCNLDQFREILAQGRDGRYIAAGEALNYKLQFAAALRMRGQEEEADELEREILNTSMPVIKKIGVSVHFAKETASRLQFALNRGLLAYSIWKTEKRKGLADIMIECFSTAAFEDASKAISAPGILPLLDCMLNERGQEEVMKAVDDLLRHWKLNVRPLADAFLEAFGRDREYRTTKLKMLEAAVAHRQEDPDYTLAFVALKRKLDKKGAATIVFCLGQLCACLDDPVNGNNLNLWRALVDLLKTLALMSRSDQLPLDICSVTNPDRIQAWIKQYFTVIAEEEMQLMGCKVFVCWMFIPDDIGSGFVSKASDIVPKKLDIQPIGPLKSGLRQMAVARDQFQRQIQHPERLLPSQETLLTIVPPAATELKTVSSVNPGFVYLGKMPKYRDNSVPTPRSRRKVGQKPEYRRLRGIWRIPQRLKKIPRKDLSRLLSVMKSSTSRGSLYERMKKKFCREDRNKSSRFILEEEEDSLVDEVTCDSFRSHESEDSFVIAEANCDIDFNIKKSDSRGQRKRKRSVAKEFSVSEDTEANDVQMGPYETDPKRNSASWVKNVLTPEKRKRHRNGNTSQSIIVECIPETDRPTNETTVLIDFGFDRGLGVETETIPDPLSINETAIANRQSEVKALHSVPIGNEGNRIMSSQDVCESDYELEILSPLHVDAPSEAAGIEGLPPPSSSSQCRRIDADVDENTMPDIVSSPQNKHFGLSQDIFDSPPTSESVSEAQTGEPSSHSEKVEKAIDQLRLPAPVVKRPSVAELNAALRADRLNLLKRGAQGDSSSDSSPDDLEMFMSDVDEGYQEARAQADAVVNEILAAEREVVPRERPSPSPELPAPSPDTSVENLSLKSFQSDVEDIVPRSISPPKAASAEQTTDSSTDPEAGSHGKESTERAVDAGSDNESVNSVTSSPSHNVETSLGACNATTSNIKNKNSSSESSSDEEILDRVRRDTPEQNETERVQTRRKDDDSSEVRKNKKGLLKSMKETVAEEDSGCQHATSESQENKSTRNRGRDLSDSSDSDDLVAIFLGKKSKKVKTEKTEKEIMAETNNDDFDKSQKEIIAEEDDDSDDPVAMLLGKKKKSKARKTARKSGGEKTRRNKETRTELLSLTEEILENPRESRTGVLEPEFVSCSTSNEPSGERTKLSDAAIVEKSERKKSKKSIKELIVEGDETVGSLLEKRPEVPEPAFVSCTDDRSETTSKGKGKKRKTGFSETACLVDSSSGFSSGISSKVARTDPTRVSVTIEEGADQNVVANDRDTVIKEDTMGEQRLSEEIVHIDSEDQDVVFMILGKKKKSKKPK